MILLQIEKILLLQIENIKFEIVVLLHLTVQQLMNLNVLFMVVELQIIEIEHGFLIINVVLILQKFVEIEELIIQMIIEIKKNVI